MRLEMADWSDGKDRPKVWAVDIIEADWNGRSLFVILKDGTHRTYFGDMFTAYIKDDLKGEIING